MLRKLLIIASILSLISCQSLSKKESEEAAKTEEEAPFQTVENEQQALELNQQAEAAAVQEIEVQDRVFFGYDSSEISEDAKKILTTQVAWLKSDPSIKITIEGHCDERGTREYNIALGELRANAVKNFLVQNEIDATRMRVVSYGKERPAFLGAGEGIFAKNRRVVTVVGQE